MLKKNIYLLPFFIPLILLACAVPALVSGETKGQGSQPAVTPLASALPAATPGRITPQAVPDLWYVCTDALTVLSGPGREFKVVGWKQQDDLVIAYEWSAGWVRIDPGRWVWSWYLCKHGG